MKKTLSFVFEKETPGAVRFKEVDAAGDVVEQADSTIGTLYIRKTALNGNIPRNLNVTIETVG